MTVSTTWSAILMSGLADLSDTIAAIYDAAIDPGRWEKALEVTAAFVGGRTASIGISDTVTHKTLIRCSWGVPQSFQDSYAQYVATMPFYQLYAQMQVEEVKAGSQMYDMDVFHASAFYKEWAGPQGLEDVAALCIMNDRRRFGMFGVNTGIERDLVGPRELERLSLLAPHVRRAAAISDLLDVNALVATQLEDALDVVSAGILLVGQDLNVIHANGAASRHLGEASALVSSRGRLSARSPHTHAALARAVNLASQGDQAMGRAGFCLPAPGHSGDPRILHVLPVAHGAARRSMAPKAVAAVFVAPETVPAASSDALAALFDLSRAEARAMAAIGDGKSQSEAAAVLGVSENTIKTHLNAIYRKTGLSRRAEIVDLVGSLRLPAAG